MLVISVFEVTNTLFQLQSINNNKKDATLAEPDYSLERAKSTLFLYLPGVTPGIFLFLVFGTTSGCRTALKCIFFPTTCKRAESKPRFAIGRSWRRVKNKAPEQTAQNPFADSSEANPEEEQDPSRPLPVAGLVSKYNESFGASYGSPHSKATYQTQKYSWPPERSSTKEGRIEEAHALELYGITSLEQTREEYYQPSPDQSDDSGPILPIMSI